MILLLQEEKIKLIDAITVICFNKETKLGTQQVILMHVDQEHPFLIVLLN